MLRYINQIIIAGMTLMAIQPALSMEIYTVKSGDYLYKIAKNHSIGGIINSELIDAIKGINKSEIPEILDDKIKAGYTLAIPTTKSEVEDGLILVRDSLIEKLDNKSNYNLPYISSMSTNSSDLGVDSKSSITISKDISPTSINTMSQDKIPVLLPDDNTSININNASQIYKNNSTLSDSINAKLSLGFDVKIKKLISFFFYLLKLIFYIFTLVLLFFLAKRFLKSINTKKEQELEILGKRKRDHLMSRISPVVSDNDFYKSDKDSSQENLNFSTNNKEILLEDNLNEDNQKYNVKEKSKDLNFINLKNKFQNQKDVAIKTEKGVFFETSSNDVIVGNYDNEVEEFDSRDKEEQELQYIDDLIEQYLDSEKYLESSITIQDVLEKYPNNIDLRYKLLEVYAHAGDEISFEGEVHFIKSKNIVSMFDPLHQKIAKLRDKYFE